MKNYAFGVDVGGTLCKLGLFYINCPEKESRN